MYFGKNIKKIRSIKKLSQAGFAEIFGIKRSSIGAYEEGRAEPKLEIIIKIAKHFSISVDNLVNSEITVNELYNFHLFNEYIADNQHIEGKLSKVLEITSIPIASTKDIMLKSLKITSDDSRNMISLPGLTNKHLAILVEKDGFYHLPKQIKNNDIIVVYPEFVLDNDVRLADKLYLVKSEKNLNIGEVKRINNEEYLLIVPDSIPVAIQKTEIDYIIPIEKHISNNPVVSNEESDRIRKMELLINDLYNRI